MEWGPILLPHQKFNKDDTNEGKRNCRKYIKQIKALLKGEKETRS